MRFPLCARRIIRSNENINLRFSVQLVESPAVTMVGSHPAFNTCAHSLRGAVLCNIFHLLLRRAKPPMSSVFFPNLPNVHVCSLWAANLCSGSFVFLGPKPLLPAKHKQCFCFHYKQQHCNLPCTPLSTQRTVRQKDLPTHMKGAGWDRLVCSRNEGKPQAFAFLSKQINARLSLAIPVCSVPGIWAGYIALFPSLQCVTNIFYKIVDNASKKHLQIHPALYSQFFPFTTYELVLA